MSGIGVILNPRSRKNLRDPSAAGRLAKQLGDHGVVRLARSIDELHRIAEDFKKLDIDVLGISAATAPITSPSPASSTSTTEAHCLASRSYAEAR